MNRSYKIAIGDTLKYKDISTIYRVASINLEQQQVTCEADHGREVFHCHITWFELALKANCIEYFRTSIDKKYQHRLNKHIRKTK